MQGIYKISNINNNKIYIGSAKNITNRWKQHIDKLYGNVHDNYKLQEDYNKYGINSFVFSIIEIVQNENDLFKREQYWIDTINVENNYNILSYAHYEYVDRIKDHYNILDFKLTKSQETNLRNNISIFDNEKINSIGENKNDLSKTWFGSATKKQINTLKNHLSNYCRYYISNKKCLYWTTFTSYQKILGSKGIIKKFVSLVDIPSIKYNNLAFLVNLYSNPFLKREININDDVYALKILLKWIINVSEITKPIIIYIPSLRMRELLVEWLESLN